jgi:PGF-CTERM protein
VQSAYDAQFGESEAAAYTRDDITQAKYDYDFADVSAETAGEMEALYDRQPFAGSSPDEIRTREELSATTYGVDHDDLSRDSRLTIERLYHAQFGVTASPANFSVVALSATEAPAGTETVHVTARITNHGSTTATQSVELRLDRDGDETLDDEALANESLTLDSGATAQVNFTAPLDAFETGTSRYGVATANDSRRATLDDGTLAAATTEDDPYTGGVGTENVTDDTESEGPVSAPEMRDGEAVVDLSALRANHRYEVDLGDDVTANGVTVTGQELMLVRSDDGGGLRVAASKTAMDDAPALTGTFAYLRVEAAGLADEDIMEVDFVFRVSPSRLNETGVDPNDVRLYRYHDGEWESYETIHRGDGRFESGDVPGFSVFAVGPTGASAMTAASAEGERETETPTPTASPTPTETSDAEVTTTAPATDASTGTPAATAVTTSRSTTSSRTPGFTPVTVLAALVGSVFLIRRLRARR